MTEHSSETITVMPGGELERALERAAHGPVRLVRHGRYYRLTVEPENAAAETDGDAVGRMLDEAAGSWAGLDPDEATEFVRQARALGSRPNDRP